MTTRLSIDKICGACGKKVPVEIMGSTSSFGNCDLDFRPPALKRWTMDLWLEECPSCGYVSGSIDLEPKVSSEWIHSSEYNVPEEFSSNLIVNKFYRYYLICEKLGDYKHCFWALKCMAWAFDDEKNQSNAIKCRELSLKYIDKSFEDDKENIEGQIILKSDILRRCGRFDEALTILSAHKFVGNFEQAAEFEKKLCRSKDLLCHNYGECS